MFFYLKRKIEIKSPDKRLNTNFKAQITRKEILQVIDKF